MRQAICFDCCEPALPGHRRCAKHFEERKIKYSGPLGPEYYKQREEYYYNYRRERRTTTIKTGGLNYRRSKHDTVKWFFTRMLDRCAQRAKNKNWEINITLQSLMDLYEHQQHLCALTKRELVISQDTARYPEKASIDRIDPSKGYTTNNVRLVCYWVNLARNVWSDDVLLDWCKAVQTTMGGVQAKDPEPTKEA